MFTFSFFWRPKNYWKKKVFSFFSFISTRKFIMKSDLTLIKFNNRMCVERNWWVIWKIRLPEIKLWFYAKWKRIWNRAENFRTRLDVMLKSEYFVVKKKTFSSCRSLEFWKCDVTGSFFVELDKHTRLIVKWRWNGYKCLIK